MAKINEITAKSLLRKHKKIDSWFISRYGMNLYRGCLHDCSYCDGRAEGYYVEGEFGTDVDVKINAPALLEKELNPARKRKPMVKGFILPGGGVGDSYQAIEKDYKLTREVLGIIKKYNFPVHILTKSTLVERDIDLLKEINSETRAIVSFSFSSTDNKISSVFEPGVPSPSMRLETISKLKKEGISSGMFLMPLIPLLTDTVESLRKTVQDAKDAGVDYIVFGGMTLKSGRQKSHYYNILQKHYPELVSKYNKMYLDDKWGHAIGRYYTYIHNNFNEVIRDSGIPTRIPPRLYNTIINQNDLVVVILEQIDYLLKQKGEKSPYGYAAYQISQLQESISNADTIKKISGLGKAPLKLIQEIIETGTSAFHEKLLRS